MTAESPYIILGVSRNASESEIKAAYRKAARKYHPDKQKTPEDRERASATFARIANAYETLTDPVKRYDWNSQHGPPSAPSTPTTPTTTTTSSSSSYGGSRGSSSSGSGSSTSGPRDPAGRKKRRPHPAAAPARSPTGSVPPKRQSTPVTPNWRSDTPQSARRRSKSPRRNPSQFRNTMPPNTKYPGTNPSFRPSVHMPPPSSEPSMRPTPRMDPSLRRNQSHDANVQKQNLARPKAGRKSPAEIQRKRQQSKASQQYQQEHSSHSSRFGQHQPHPPRSKSTAGPSTARPSMVERLGGKVQPRPNASRSPMRSRSSAMPPRGRSFVSGRQ